MASLIRPVVVRYLLDGQRVPKGTPKAKKVKERSRLWYGQGIPGLPPKKRVPLRTANKRVAQTLLADLVDSAERGNARLPARDEAARPLGPLVMEFEEAVGRSANRKHVVAVVDNVRRVLDGCSIATVGDLRADDLCHRVESFVWGLTKGKEGTTSATAAYVGKHARQFTRWLWRKRKVLASDPLAGMALPSQAVATPRRALTVEELAALVNAAEASPKKFSGTAGKDRAMIYLVAVATGYRTGELGRLTPSHFDLDADQPVVRLAGKHTKNKKAAEQPLPSAVVARLRAYLDGRPADRPLWPGNWKKRAAEMMQADLAAAGIPAIVGDELAVFHSLRHSYTTLLAQTAPLKVVQELSRHSDPRLTIGRYSHATTTEKVAAVDRLPLPGSTAAAAGPFAALSRDDLEGLAGALLFVVASLLVAPPVAPGLHPTGNSERHPETKPAARSGGRSSKSPRK